MVDVGHPRHAALGRELQAQRPGGRPAGVVEQRVERPIGGRGWRRRVEQEAAVLMVEQHPLTIVADRDRGQRGRHAQDMLDRAEIDPVPFQLVEGEAAVGVLTQAAHQRRLDAKLGRCHRRVAGHAAQHRVEVIGDVLAGSPRHLAVAEDEIDDGDADAQDPCHCLPELVAATVAGRLGRGPGGVPPVHLGGLWLAGISALRSRS